MSEEVRYLVHDTGNLEMAIFNEGSIGAYSANPGGPGILWKGNNGAYCGGIIFGSSERGMANGLWGSFRGVDENLVHDIKNVASNFASGFTSDANFDRITQAVLNDAGAPNPYDVNIIQRSYSNTGDNFGFIRYGFVNKNQETLHDFYAGIFVDWDIGYYKDNSGGYVLKEDLVYENGSADPTHFGIAALSGLSGMKVTPNQGIDDNVRKGSFEWISTLDQNPISGNDDVRSWTGSRLGDLVPDDTVWVTFAVVAGDNLEEIKANARAARNKALKVGWADVTTEIENNTDQRQQPNEFTLLQNYPNPFNPSTRIKFSVPRDCHVTVTIYNVLGKKVATLVDDNKKSGVYQVEFNGSDYTSGVYLYKIKAGDFVKTKKMLLLR